MFTENRGARVSNRCFKSTRSAVVRALELFDQYNVPAEHVYPIMPSEVPHWLIRRPQCRLDLTNGEKSALHPVVWKLRFRSVIVDYKDHVVFYPDGP